MLLFLLQRHPTDYKGLGAKDGHLHFMQLLNSESPLMTFLHFY